VAPVTGVPICPKFVDLASPHVACPFRRCVGHCHGVLIGMEAGGLVVTWHGIGRVLTWLPALLNGILYIYIHEQGLTSHLDGEEGCRHGLGTRRLASVLRYEWFIY
jgi:hypothetical protein